MKVDLGCHPVKSLCLASILLMLTLICAPIYAQTPFHIIYNTNDGLPSSEVYNIHFTDDHKVWFTTDRGIAIYDGYEFTSLSSQDGLKSNTNFNIKEDSKNRLWFTGIDGSLSLFDGSNFINAPILDSLKSFVHPEFYFSPIENGEGQYLFLSRRSIFTMKSFAIWNVGTTSIDTFGAASFEKKYLYKEGGDVNLVKFGESVFAFSEEIGFYKPLHRHENNYIGGSFFDIYKLNDEGNILQKANVGARVDFCYIDSDGDLWAGTNQGLKYFENADLQNDPKTFFPKFNITDLKEDYEGNYWVATGDVGVLFVPNLKINTLNYIDKNSIDGRILSVSSLKNKIYFGSYWEEIFSIDKNFRIDTIFYTSNKYTRNLSHAYKKNNTLYFSRHGLKEYDDGSYEVMANYDRKYNVMMRELDDGWFFMGGRNGFAIEKEGEKTVESNDFEPAFDSRIESVEQDKKGNIWIGTFNGLFKMTSQNNFSEISESADPLLSKHRIKDLKVDPYDNLWVATIGQGLMYKTPDSVYHFNEENGLLSNQLNCIFLQDSNSVWIGSNRGLNHFTYTLDNDKLDMSRIRYYEVMDGLSSNFINDIDYWNNFLWLATNQGIVYIKPEALRTTHPLVPIFLENFIVNDEVKKPEDVIKLKTEENDILIQMTGVSYRKKNLEGFYRYRLSDSKELKSWNYTNDRNIRFIDLPPGKYTFEAAAKNKLNEWSDVPIHLKFEIEPHFTQTLLFKFLIGAIVLSIFILSFLFRDRQLKQRGRLRQNLMEEKMRAKEYELLALRNQMNPHFVFNSLNAIQHFVFKNDRLKANYYLSKFSKLMRDSLEFSRSKFISLEDEIQFIKTYLELEQMRFPDSFDYEIKIDPDIPIKQYAIPSLLFQPVLENIIKHAFKDIAHKGLIEIFINKMTPGKSISVIIQDNGTGFEGNFFAEKSDEAHKSLGLTIIKNQINALNMDGKQQKASFIIENRADSNSAISGIKVSFEIPVKLKNEELSATSVGILK